ncbi:MAG: hypothetical protein IKF97_07255 [Clostridia bacterium]|nr:hypothetical protein [Clostridia bacterium]
MENRKFLEVVIRDALFHLRKHLEDSLDANAKLGIRYPSRAWKKIIANLDFFNRLAKANNLEISVSYDTRHIFYNLIEKEIWQ